MAKLVKGKQGGAQGKKGQQQRHQGGGPNKVSGGLALGRRLARPTRRTHTVHQDLLALAVRVRTTPREE